jgi:guanylate kinase
MQPQIDAGEFVESASVHTNLYGTSKAAVATVRKQGRICILDIDIQGVKTCQATEFPVALYCFIAPPTMDVLERRLRSRGTETEEAIRTRLNNAFKEVEEAKHVRFDLWIVNDDLNTAYEYVEMASVCLLRRSVRRVCQFLCASQTIERGLVAVD